MRQYTIANTLALFLGVLSVVARSLPERRSEINVRSPGDIGNPNQRLEELGLVKVSEGVLDKNIHTPTYSMSKNTTFPKRDGLLDPLDLLSHRTSTMCNTDTTRRFPAASDCAAIYQEFQSAQGTFTVLSSQAAYRVNGQCLIGLSNKSPFNVNIDWVTFGRTLELITNDCIIGQQIGTAFGIYEDVGATDHPYVFVAGPLSS